MAVEIGRKQSEGEEDRVKEQKEKRSIKFEESVILLGIYLLLTILLSHSSVTSW